MIHDVKSQKMINHAEDYAQIIKFGSSLTGC